MRIQVAWTVVLMVACLLPLHKVGTAAKPSECFSASASTFVVVAPEAAIDVCSNPATHCTNIAMQVISETAPIPADYVRAASGSWADCIDSTGWADFKITTNASHPDRLQAFAAGFGEGFVSQRRIYEYAQNAFVVFFGNKTELFNYPSGFLSWMYNHSSFIVTNIHEHATGKPGDYWSHVQLLLDQVDGVSEGYALATSGLRMAHALTYMDILVLQLAGDLEQILPVSVPSSTGHFWANTDPEARDWSQWRQMSRKEAFRRISASRCTAMVKLAADLSDLWTAHTTWGHFSVMTRVFKHYDLRFAGVASSSMSLSSYPGAVASIDDFYSMHDTKLVVTETTNDILNDELLKAVTPHAVLYWMRVMISNRLSTSTVEWTTRFAEYNSGTYNNQWIVVDYKLFTPGKALLPNTVRILEQVPGSTDTLDITPFVVQGHWPSYNRPFFPQYYSSMGYEYFAATYGNEYSYQLAPRAEFFRRDADKVQSLSDMQAFMLQNDYEHDPLSGGYPGNAIAARFDLKGGPYDDSSAGWFYHGLHGGIDSKIVSAALVQSAEVAAYSGPTHTRLPPFEWTSEWDMYPHVGLPTVWNFDWVTVSA